MREPVPWVGLAALVAMFVLPFLPAWLWEGPSVVRHRPRRHVCTVCGWRWTAGHVCVPPAPLDQHDRVPVELVRLPEEAVWNMGELEGRRDGSS